ncbi:DUF5348 domain-containing protein [Paenibacillus alkaliterrae]
MPMTRTYRDGRMLYDARYDRWTVWDLYAKPCPLHCGEAFDLKVGQHFLPCRIEMDCEWFIEFSNTKFYLHPDVSYWIRVR